MATINRALTVNPVEPAHVSMKFSTGLDTKVEVVYLQQNGAPYTVDLAGQLYIVGRSTGQVQQYALPATDVVNGKARAFIPAGDVVDVNGYNVQIIGTVDGDAKLIARGSASVYETEALGSLPADLIDNVPISLAYNFDASITIRLWKDAGKMSPYDLGTTLVSATIYSDTTMTVGLANFTVTPTALAGEVILSLPASVVNTLPLGCWWSLRASTAAGITTLCQGNVTITGIQP